MNRHQLATEVLGTRFRETHRTAAKRWLDVRYRQLWTSRSDWRFLYREDEAVQVTAGVRLLGGLDSTVGFVQALRTADGAELQPLGLERWRDLYVGDTTSGDPGHYTVVNGTVYVAPTPSSNSVLEASYKLRLCHHDSTGTSVQPGLMDEDTDQPLWDAAWHDVLIPGAIATGLKERNDPTWPSLEEEFVRQMGEMWQELRVDRGGARLAYQAQERPY